MPERFSSIGEAIKKDPGLQKIRKLMLENDIVDEFEKIFPSLKKIAMPVSVGKKTLLLKVENAAWRNELKFKEKILIEKINKYFADKEGNSEEEFIKKIKFLG